MQFCEITSSELQVYEDTWILDRGNIPDANIWIKEGVTVHYTALPLDACEMRRVFYINSKSQFVGSALCVYDAHIHMVSDICGDGASSQMNILALASARKKFSIEGIARVSKPYRSVYTRVDQTNILLGEDASVRGIPRLDIATDDIEGGHSCRIHRLGGEALFYLESRGLSQQHAETLLLNSEILRHLSTVPEEFRDMHCREIHHALCEI